MTRTARLAGRTLRMLALASPRLAGRLAFRLFARPAGRARVRPGERDVHDQAHRETVPLAGHQVVVYRWGDGTRPVLLLHGWSSRGSRYAPLVSTLLARGFSPVTCDAPGHGESSGRSTHILEYAAVVHGLQRRYGPFEAVVGHSIGGLTAFQALRTNGAAPTRLVTIASPCEFGYLPDSFTRTLALGPRIGAQLRRRIERFFAPETGIWERFSASYRPADVPASVLVVHDQQDRMVDPAQAELIVAAYGNRARLVATRGLGHSRILSAPEVVDHVVDFLTTAPPGNPAVAMDRGPRQPVR